MNDRQQKAVDRPTNIGLARWMAGYVLSSHKPAQPSDDRGLLEQAFLALFDEPPRIGDALKEAEACVAHAWRGSKEENRPESWACACIAELLRRPA